MNDVLSKLTGTQALHVLERLASRDSGMAEIIADEAKCMLAEVDIDETAEEVFAAFDAIAVEDCWDRSGADRDEYTSPEEAAVELIEEELQPFADQAKRYHELDMREQERDYCAGVILGLYRYEKESKSAFRDWSEDLPLDSAGWLLDEWRKRNTDEAVRHTMDAFFWERCPKWAKDLVRGNLSINA